MMTLQERLTLKAKAKQSTQMRKEARIYMHNQKRFSYLMAKAEAETLPRW